MIILSSVVVSTVSVIGVFWFLFLMEGAITASRLRAYTLLCGVKTRLIPTAT